MADSFKRPEPTHGSNDSDLTSLFDPLGKSSELVRILDDYLAQLQKGVQPDKAALLSGHPELARELNECLAGIDFVHHAAQGGQETPVQLGDFRIIREIGRGGMGVVYEAEQITLKRRVALKVLRIGLGADEEAARRFQREAETVAHLHHTNIVPIHAIGREAGIHYYAMQFIEGQSLARILDNEKKDAPIPRDYRTIALWCLQAAEALAHAHQRGVIHRDIKPSNLILDAQGTVWLTDFGLAKRSEEVSLTLAGVLMGTPRYMSPEQATATTQPIDHRTDIYSLGATLYELATGKPVFDATSPQGVITQILHQEPRTPRSLDPHLPRDLETIILKCLSKEPGRRYQRASDLVEDLRAFLDNRPIRARRANLLEKGIRWVGKNRKTAGWAILATASGMVLAVSALFAAQAYRDSQKGNLVLKTDGPTLIAEVFNPGAKSASVRVPVPTAQPVALPEGDYLVRVSGQGAVSEDWTVQVVAGQTIDLTLRLPSRHLGSPLDWKTNDAPQFVKINGASHLLVKGDRGYRLIKGSTQQTVWPTEWGVPGASAPFEGLTWNCPGGKNLDILQATTAWPVSETTGETPGIASLGSDIDGDGIEDLIFGSRVSTGLLAASGASGKGLWFAWIPPGFAEGFDPSKDPIDWRTSNQNGGILGKPTVVMTDTGETLILAMVVHFRYQIVGSSRKTVRGDRQFQMVALNPRDGKERWRAPLEFPDLIRDYYDHLRLRFPESPTVVKHRGATIAAMAVQGRVIGLDLATGKPAWPPFQAGFAPVQTPYLGDLNGDGECDALLMREKSDGSEEIQLMAVSLDSGRTLWEKISFSPIANASFGDPSQPRGNRFVVSHGPSGQPAAIAMAVRDRWSTYGPHWFGIESIDPATGASRWINQLQWVKEFAGTGALARLGLLEGPDRDGDGVADLYVTWAFRIPGGYRPNEFAKVRVAALSQKDGTTLCLGSHPMGDANLFNQGHFFTRWWQKGADGWPLLLVPLTEGLGGQPVTAAFSSRDGSVAHILNEVENPWTLDVNDDGIPEICHLQGKDRPRKLAIIKGLSPTVWKRTNLRVPGADFDGDGVLDLIEMDLGFVVRSGKDDRVLWRCRAGLYQTRVLLLDVNRDRVPDVISVENGWDGQQNHGVLCARSGIDGKTLWRQAVDSFRGNSAFSQGRGPMHDYGYPLLREGPLDLEGMPTLLFAFKNRDNQLLCQALASGSGKPLWETPIAEKSIIEPNNVDRHLFADLNGDGWQDLVVWMPRDPGKSPPTKEMELRALSGKDGSEIWTWKGEQPSARSMAWPRPAIADLDGDGRPEVVVTTSEPQQFELGGGKIPMELIVLKGDRGQILWRWTWTSQSPDLWGPLILDARRDGKRLICLGIQDTQAHTMNSNGRIVVLDPGGQLVFSIHTNPKAKDPNALVLTDPLGKQGKPRDLHPTQWFNLGFRCWGSVGGVSSRGECLVFRGKDGVVCLDLVSRTPVWFFPFQDNAIHGPLATLKFDLHPVSHRALVTGMSTALGLDLTTGKGLWRIDTPDEALQSLERNAQVAGSTPVFPGLLLGSSTSGPTTLGWSWPVREDGTYDTDAVPRLDPSPFQDPGRLRRLPWLGNLGPIWDPEGVRFEVPRIHSVEWLGWLLLGAQLFGAMAGGKWARLAWGAALWLVLTGIAMALLLGFARLNPGESYSWVGWAWIFVQTAAILGWLSTLSWFFPVVNRWIPWKRSALSPLTGVQGRR